MTNNNHKNEGCGFAEEIVSYLYDETGAAESAAFEAHLQNCAACADELKAFSGVHFSINEWKTKEFDTLATPVIEIRYEKTVEKTEATAGWFAGLRGLFSLTPGWSLATASLAILAVCVGIVLFAMNARKGNDVADSGNRNQNPVVAPTVERSPQTANVNVNEKTPEQFIKPVKEQQTPQPELAVQSDPKKTNAQKTTNNSRETNKTVDKNAPKTNVEKRGTKNNTDVPPSIMGDEEEDDTLRLAELFEEIDTDE